MGRSQLQGTPWHEEQIKKTCKEGSKYCIYNRNICSCTYSIYYHKKCVGKGQCMDFESKSGVPKSKNIITYKGNLAGNKRIQRSEHSLNVKNDRKDKSKNMSTNNKDIKETKEDKFMRLSEGRINKIEKAIDNLGKLSDKHTYAYTDQQVDKMFSYLENKLKTAKNKFKNINDGFEW